MTADSGSPEQPRVSPVLPPPDAVPPPVPENIKLQQIARIRQNLGISAVTNWELEKATRKDRIKAAEQHMKGYVEQEAEIDVEESFRELTARKTGVSALGMEGMISHTATLIKLKAAHVSQAERTLDILEKIQVNDLHEKDGRREFYDLLKSEEAIRSLSQIGDVPELVRRLSVFGCTISSVESLLEYATDERKQALTAAIMKGNGEVFTRNCKLFRQKGKTLYGEIYSHAMYGTGNPALSLLEELGRPLTKEAVETLELLQTGYDYTQKTGIGFVKYGEEEIDSFSQLVQQKGVFEERFRLMASIIDSMGITDADPQKVVDALSDNYEHILRGVVVFDGAQRRRALDSFENGFGFSSWKTFTEPEFSAQAVHVEKRMEEIETREAFQLIADIGEMTGKRVARNEKMLDFLDMPHQLDALDTVGKLAAESGIKQPSELFNLQNQKTLLDINAVTQLIHHLPEGRHDSFRVLWETAHSRKLLGGTNTLASFLLGEIDFVEQHLTGCHIDRQIWEKMVPDLRFDAKDRQQYNMTAEAVPYFDLLFDRELGAPEYTDLAKAYQRGLDNVRSYPSLQSGIRQSLLTRLDRFDGFFADGKPTRELLYSYLGKDETMFDRLLDRQQIFDLVESLPQQERELYDAYEAYFFIKDKTAPYVRAMLTDGESVGVKRELFIRAASLIRSLPTSIAGAAGTSVFEELKPVLDQGGNVEQVQLDKAARALRIIELTNSTQSNEIKRIMPSLKPLLMEAPDVEKAFDQIERMLLHNNLPQPLKNYLVMEVLFSQRQDGTSRMEDIFTKDQGDVLLSPALKSRNDSERMMLIFRRVMRNAIQSGDPSMKNYLEAYREAIDVLELVDTHGIEITSHYHPQLLRFLDKAEALSGRILPGEQPDRSVTLPEQTVDQISLRLNRLAHTMGVATYKEIPLKLREMFLKPLGYGSFTDALQAMDTYQAEAQKRNRAFAESVRAGGSVFNESDLLKSTQSDIMNDLMKNGPQCAELLGADSSSNNTPFDADFSRVGASDAGLSFNDVLSRSITRTSMTQDNDVLLLVKNRGNFTDTSGGAQDYKTDDERYETFWSQYGDKHYGIPGDPERRHFGVTVGVAATDISAVILTDAFVHGPDYTQKLNKLKFDITNGSCYVPVLHQGKLVFTPEEYDAVKLSKQQIADAMEELNTKGKSGTAVLDALIKNPLMAQMFGQPARVQEGYTVGEHTRLVLGQFDKYVKDYLVLMNMNQGEFALMLSLHDIGKSFSDDTREQHRFTRPIIENVVRGLDMPQIRKDLVVEIASQDILGEYIKGDIDQAKALQDIRYIAGKTGLTPLEIFQMCRYYYTCDVSSYTKDADPNGIGRFDNDIHFREPDQNVVFNAEWTAKLNGLKEVFLKQWLQERGNS